MLTKLISLFVIVPLVELAILIEVGRYLGTLNTILIVIITGLLGAVLAKIEGLRVWYNLQKDLMEFKMPTDRLIDGVLVLVGGVLLLTPGIITDILGFLLIVPLTRAGFRKYLKRRFKKRVSRRFIEIR